MPPLLSFLVDSLFVYPIKACSGVRVSQLHFAETGMIQGDREWVVIDVDDAVVWQGAHPRLALIRPTLHGADLVLDAQGESPLPVPNPGADSSCAVRIWNDATKTMESHTGFDAGGGVARFLERVTKARLRLVRLDASACARKSINPVHLASVQSLAELNQFLASRGLACAEMSRFRPNVVLRGQDAQVLPFTEEQVSRFVWGPGAEGHQLAVFGKCVRCIVPNVNPATAAIEDEPLQSVSALSAQRYPGEPSYFGVYGRPKGPASLPEGEILRAELSF